jgi:hypothetical protein
MLEKHVKLVKMRSDDVAIRTDILSQAGIRTRKLSADHLAIRAGKYVFIVFGKLKLNAHSDLDHLMKRSRLLFDHLFCVETRMA